MEREFGPDELGSSRPYLERQYGSDANLAARQSIYAYQRPRLDLYASTLDLAALRGHEAVLDVGCGNGRYLATVAGRGHRGPAVGADLSVGMLEAARGVTAFPLCRADAQRLPFRAGAFDVALAMHMLYHVPDRPRALAEIRRVLAPGGAFHASTNGRGFMRELIAVVGPRWRFERHIEAFGLETGPPQLEPFFDDVTVERFANELVVTEVEPMLAYVRSSGSFRGGELDGVRAELAAALARDGAFRITTGAGLISARPKR